MEKSTCVVDGCDRAPHTKGMCAMHYQRVRKTGSTAPTQPVRGGRKYRDPETCSIDGCGSVERRAGLCGAHHQRLRTYGDPNYVTPRPQQNGVLPCSVEGCGKVSKAGGRSGKLYCAMHYERYSKYGDPLVAGRRSECAICGTQFVKRNKQRCCSIECRKELVARSGYLERRRALERGATVEKFARAEIFERDGWICHLCGGLIDRDARPRSSKAPSLDHVIPLSLGGEHSRANTKAAHFGCNARKGNRTGMFLLE